MVRKENLELWDFLKDAHVRKHRGGLVITGQPGTGKTRSLRDVLARALKERIPVAFCDQPGEYYFCDGTGCRRYSTEEYVLHDVEPGKFFLALVDSHATLVSPPQNFIDQSQRCYTVQAASPHPRRWRDWAKERGDVQYWVWPFWSETEVRNLQHYYEQERYCPWKDDNEHYYSPVELFKLLGPSARLCFPWAGTRKESKDPMDDFVPYLQPNDVFEKVDDFITAMKTGVVTSPRQGLNFHRLFVTFKPFGVFNFMFYGLRFYHVIATDAISKRLLHHFNQRTIEERVSLLSKFASYPVLMGLLYEPLVLQFLTTLETPISYHLVNGLTMTLGPGLRLASLQFDPDTSIEPHPNDIHVPPINFPSLDAFIIIIDKGRTEILLLQMTVATTHKVVLKGVAAVVNLLRRSMKDFSVKFIFVTPGPSGEKMARKLQKIKIRGRSPIVIDVGWMETGQLLQCDDDVLRALVRCDGDNVELECEDDDSDTEPPAKRARIAS